jgi:hypothetical protein
MVDVAPDDRIDLDHPSSLTLYGDDRAIYGDQARFTRSWRACCRWV